MASKKKTAAQKEKNARSTGDPDAAQDGLPGEAVPHVWDHPDASDDPPSQRPEDTYEEADRQRRAG